MLKEFIRYATPKEIKKRKRKRLNLVKNVTQNVLFIYISVSSLINEIKVNELFIFV